jgi:GAF domain-containing protein
MTHPSEPSGVDLVAAFTRLQSLTLSTARVSEFLSELAAVAPQLGGPAMSCSITVRGEHDPYTVTSSDDLAGQADEMQYDQHEGPCLQALHDGSVIYVQDMRHESRWPGYRQHAVTVGVRSSLSLPLQVGDEVIGALNIYSRQPEAFDERLRQNLAVFAGQAAAALTMVLRQARQDQISDQLEQALASRTTIDQAIGILMAQQRCTADEAFALLRSHSQNSNRKIRDLAADIIRRVSGTPPTDGNPFNRSAR